MAWGRRLIGAALPLIALIGTAFTEYEMGATDGRIRLYEGVAMGVVLAVLMAALAARLLRSTPQLEVAPLNRLGR